MSTIHAGNETRQSESRVTPNLKFGMYTMYALNLGYKITVFDREREQGHFRGSTEGARGSIRGVQGSMGASREEPILALRFSCGHDGPVLYVHPHLGSLIAADYLSGPQYMDRWYCKAHWHEHISSSQLIYYE